MQAIPAVRISRSDLPPGIVALDPTLIDHMVWNGRRIEVLGTTDDARLIAELVDDDA